MTRMPVLAAALKYAGLGLAVIPVGADKRPAIENWQNDGSKDPVRIRDWFGPTSTAPNVGIVCGLSGLVVVDIDKRNKGFITFGELADKLGPLPDTVTAETGGGGLHYVFRAPAGVEMRGKLGLGVDLLHGGRQILVEPSIHPSGAPYRWQEGHAPGEIELAELPATWLEHARRPAAARPPAISTRDLADHDEARMLDRAEKYLAKMPPAIQGQDGSGALWDAALAMVRGFSLPRSVARTLLLHDYNPRCEPPWAEWEVDKKIDDVTANASVPYGYIVDRDPQRTQRAPASTHGPRPSSPSRGGDDLDDSMGANPEEPRLSEGLTVDDRVGSVAASPLRYRLTELGNAARLAAAHGDRLRHVVSLGWLTWDGRRWRRDQGGSEMVAAKSVAHSLYVEAADAAKRAAAGDEEAGTLAKELAGWARTSSKKAAIQAMAKLAETEAPIAALADAFDRDGFAFNVLNGTINLRTGELRPHGRGDLITRLAPVEYAAEAVGPRWEAFLERVLPDAELRTWVQRYLGYCLTAEVTEQVLAFAFGVGANGKSVLLDVMLAVFGDYGLRAAPDLVLATQGEVHPTELADLDGRRLVVCSEIEQGRRWAESTIKRITGDTTITARRMRQDFYTFTATHKLVIAANTKPVVRGNDEAIWRRMRPVPFVVTIPPAERDKTLVRTLVETEGPGILAWLVRGCLAWQRDGLGESAAILAAAEGYRADQDVLGQWIDEECVLIDVFTPTVALYTSFMRWCQATGIEVWSRETMRSRLSAREGLTDRRTGQARGFQGIGLRSARADGGRSDDE